MPWLNDEDNYGQLAVTLHWFMLLLSARGSSIPFFGLNVPALIPADNATAGSIKEIHETLATVGCFLIGGHAAAGLFHHNVVRDNTLQRMMVGRRRIGY